MSTELQVFVFMYEWPWMLHSYELHSY